MASKIKYTDKVAIQNDTSIPSENKVTDDDMNEIKKAVNNNADELITAQENISELEGKNTENETNIQELQNKLNESETNISNLQKDNTTNKADIASIKEKNTEQDTAIQSIKEDIEEIQEEQGTQNTKIAEIEQKNTEQDDSIEELKNTDIELKEENERLKNDIDCIAITEEAEGENLTLTETSDARFAKFEVKGNAYQATREGYNVLNLKDWTIKEKVGVEIDEINENDITLHNTRKNDNESCYVRFKGTLKARNLLC